MTYSLDYYRAGEWYPAHYVKPPGDKETEIVRLAAVRSENGLIYRVRRGRQTIAKFQNGKQLTKEGNA